MYECVFMRKQQGVDVCDASVACVERRGLNDPLSINCIGYSFQPRKGLTLSHWLIILSCLMHLFCREWFSLLNAFKITILSLSPSLSAAHYSLLLRFSAYRRIRTSRRRSHGAPCCARPREPIIICCGLIFIVDVQHREAQRPAKILISSRLQDFFFTNTQTNYKCVLFLVSG